MVDDGYDDGVARCGDGVEGIVTIGITSYSEECDDGNRDPGDGCSDLCLVEPGWNCGADACEPFCGDGLLIQDEVCDPMLTDAEHYCVDCRERIVGRCGDAERQTDFEGCDDGNATDFDGCSSCQVDFGFDCDVALECVATGIDPDRLLGELDEGELENFCDWFVNDLGGGAGTRHDCGSFTYDLYTVGECVENSELMGWPDTGHCPVSWIESLAARSGEFCVMLRNERVCDSE
jgi:cysteine-rich repeat protein